MTTEQLLAKVEAAQGSIVEASISNGLLRSTHWLSFWKGRFYDEGCDSVRRRVSRKMMLMFYPVANWKVDDI